MFDQLVQAISDYPYIGVALVFLLCGLGFPLPEELVLLAGGYICFKYPERASLLPMMAFPIALALGLDVGVTGVAADRQAGVAVDVVGGVEGGELLAVVGPVAGLAVGAAAGPVTGVVDGLGGGVARFERRPQPL